MSHKGWHSRGYLPHFDSAEAIQFVTFRLADSLPRAVAEALGKLEENLAETDARLDAGLGSCCLAEPAVANVVQDALMHFDGQRYLLFAWCIMPNHVHVVIEPTAGSGLGGIVHSWKSFTAKEVNRLLGRNGPLWHRDYFDRYIRDDGHLVRTVQYIENNPVKAGLVSDSAEWQWSSHCFRL